jgi:hypothetical protein
MKGFWSTVIIIIFNHLNFFFFIQILFFSFFLLGIFTFNLIIIV